MEIDKDLNIFILQTKGGNLQVKGTSMLPLIQDGWKVCLVPIKAKNIRIGDIVVMHKNGNFITHRIIGKITWFSQIYFLEKGDNLNTASIIRQNQIMGKVTKVINSDNSEYAELNNQNLHYPDQLFILIYFIIFKIKKMLLFILTCHKSCQQPK